MKKVTSLFLFLVPSGRAGKGLSKPQQVALSCGSCFTDFSLNNQVSKSPFKDKNEDIKLLLSPRKTRSSWVNDEREQARQEDLLGRKSCRIKHSQANELCRKGQKAGITTSAVGWNPQVSDAKYLNLQRVPDAESQPVQRSHVWTWLQIPSCFIKLCSFDL